MQPEARLVKRIREHVMARGGRPIKIWGSEEGFQEVGVADLLVCYKGFFIALEAKVGDNKPSRIQRLFLQSIRDAGGYARVVHTVGEVDLILEECDRRARGRH